MEENGNYGAAGVLLEFSCGGVKMFSGRGTIDMVDRGGGDRYVKCERRCLFSCQHLDNISDFLFSCLFCDRGVIRIHAIKYI